MVDGQRNAQRVPGYTCPVIDEAVGLLRSAVRSLERGHVDDALRELGLIDLETVRTANEDLRELGIAWYGIAAHVTDELVALRNVMPVELGGAEKSEENSAH